MLGDSLNTFLEATKKERGGKEAERRLADITSSVQDVVDKASTMTGMAEPSFSFRIPIPEDGVLDRGQSKYLFPNIYFQGDSTI